MISLALYLSHSVLGIKPYQEVDYKLYDKEKAQIVAFNKEVDCLSKAIYWEARSESDLGQELVAQTLVNRMNHKDYPSTVCGVIKYKYKGYCAITSYCDSWGMKIKDIVSYRKAVKIATKALEGGYKRFGNHILFYKVCDVENYFFKDLKLIRTEGYHCFYAY